MPQADNCPPCTKHWQQLQRKASATAAQTTPQAGASQSSSRPSSGTHPQRCLASVRSTANMPRAQDAAAQGAQGGQQQHHALFSVHVHTTAGMLLPRDSLFSGCELPVRLNTTRGYAQHVLAEAGALLLAAALSDPLNAKFVLVSDTSIPLYPPQVSERHCSRQSGVSSCDQRCSQQKHCCGVLCDLPSRALFWPPGPFS